MNRAERQEYPLGPALDFLRRLWRLNHALEKLSSRMDRRFGVTAQQRLVIRCVGKYPGVTAGQLACLLHIDPGTASATLKRLEDKRMIERRRDPRDKRRAALGLTARGRQIDRPADGTVEDAAERILTELTAAQTASMAAILERFTALLEADGAHRAPERTVPTRRSPAREVAPLRRRGVSRDPRGLPPR
jgi:DNA-binding MarR family transcriptional regulator